MSTSYCNQCGEDGNTCDCFEEEHLLIKTKRFSAPNDPCGSDNCNPSQLTAPKQEPEYDEIIDNAVIPDVGNMFTVRVRNASIYAPGQWLYFAGGHGTYKVVEVNCSTQYPEIQLLNDCDGNDTPIEGNPSPGQSIPHSTIFYPTDKPVCEPEDIDACEQHIQCENEECANSREWGVGETVSGIKVCTEDGAEVLTPPDSIDRSIILGINNEWVIANLDDIVCDIVNNGCPGSPPGCVEAESTSIFEASGVIDIPAGTTKVRLEMWGGAGGADSTGAGGAGGFTRAEFGVDVGNPFVTGATIGVIVGGGGHPPGSNFDPTFDALGGSPGFGGDGVDTGAGGWAGGGGGSFVFIGTAPSEPDSKANVVAAVGGGGATNGGGGPTIIGLSGNHNQPVAGGGLKGAAPNQVTNAGAGGGGYVGGQAGWGGKGYVSPLALAGSTIQFSTPSLQYGPNRPQGTSSPNYIAGKGEGIYNTHSGQSFGQPGMVAITFITECP